MSVRAANQFSPLFKEKTTCVKKMEIIQENNKTMYWYCLSLNSMGN